jgi:histidinol dehydrogenase
MKVYQSPDRFQENLLIQRPKMSVDEIMPFIKKVFDAIKKDGDKAVKKYVSEFDKVHLESLKVSDEEFSQSIKMVSDELKEAIGLAKINITKFHTKQISEELKVEIAEGITCWQKSVPIDSVGLYIPGGTAPLFSTVLMLAIPAVLAGCENIVLMSPPDRESGKIHPAILYTAQLCGVKKVFKIGGAQAIAAMAIGTETIPRVYKIFGPGNQYVTAAKQYSFQSGIAIDMPAGPSEVLVFADNSAIPRFIASDLLSQAEHGIDSQVVLVSTDSNVIEKSILEVEAQTKTLPRRDLIRKSLNHSYAVFFEKIEEAYDFINNYAPEHFIIASENAEKYLSLIKNAGSVFIGNYSPESAGDYASGTNHTLPTAFAARAFSGVNMDAFFKKITFQKLNKSGLLNIGNSIVAMARAEGLEAHARAVEIRLNE